MAGLSHSALCLLSEALLLIHAPGDPDAFPLRLAAALRTVFPDCEIGIERAESGPPFAPLHPVPISLVRLKGASKTASAIQQQHRTASGVDVDSTPSGSRTRKTPLRISLKTDDGRRLRMDVSLRTRWYGNDGRLRFSIKRPAREFRSEERFLLQLIAPHVAQAWQAISSSSTCPSAPGTIDAQASFHSRGNEDPCDRSLNCLLAIGLTRREAEVMFWVSKGKTSSEVAVILNSTTGTVNKHLEHIFAKLHVETRTAAAALVLEALR